MKTKLYNNRIALTVLLVIISHFFAFCKNRAEVWPFSINCPPNVTVSCHDEIWNLAIYGNATYSNGHYSYSAGAPTVKYYLNSCNSGYITRTWLVEDNSWQWHSCTQTIYVSSGGTGVPNIVWPEDVELSGCNPETSPNKLKYPYNYPTWDYSECGMLGKSYSDMLFTVNNQCKKLMRTWKDMDWCKYSNTTGYAVYSKVQFIYIINNTPPVVNCPIEIVVDASNCQNVFVNAPPVTVDQVTCGGFFEVINNSPYALSKGNNLSGTYPIGTTKVISTVKYACGQIKTCTTNIIVRNAAKPVPYCHGQLITALMGVDTDKDGKTDNGMVEVWAKDLNTGSYSTCGNLPLKYSFSKNVSDTYKVFTCDQIGKNMIDVWVTDSKGGQNFCTTEIIIQNNAANIPNCNLKSVEPIQPVYSVKGNINTLTDYPIINAHVKLQYKEPEVAYRITYDTIETILLDSFINMSGYKLYRFTSSKKITEKRDSTISFLSIDTKTAEGGKYLFDSNSILNKPVVITAAYSDSFPKNIDSKDIELLSKFLKGELVFNSYHQYLASDINEDGIIDTIDQKILTSFVSRQIDTFPGKNQWYLLDAKATFEKPEDILKGPLPFKVELDSIHKINPVVNFIAIKKGNISIDQGSILEKVSDLRRKISSGLDVDAVPNPFSGQLTFMISSVTEENGNIIIFNSNGQDVFRDNLKLVKGKQNIDMNLSHLPSGIFVYRISAGNNIISGKLSHLK